MCAACASLPIMSLKMNNPITSIGKRARLSGAPLGLSRQVPVRSLVVPRAGQQAGVEVQKSPKDPFVEAAFRLQSLLHAVGDGEDELIEQSLREEPPMSKLGLMAIGGGVITVAAVAISSLSGQDPWGGASLSLHSLESALVGAALAVPLVACRTALWSKEAEERLPALADMHRLMAEEAEPWLHRFSGGHLAAHAAMEVLSMVLLLLPAAQGGISAGLEFYSSLLQQSLLGGGAAMAAAADAGAAALPHGVGAAIALVATATCAGVVQSLNLGSDEEQVQIVKDAVANADRYYRLTASDAGSGPGSAARASTAFKAVAVSWMEAQEDASSLCGAVSFLDVLSLSAIWYATGDLAAPAVAALAVAAVDYHHLHAAAQTGAGGGRGKTNKSAPPSSSSSSSSTKQSG